MPRGPRGLTPQRGLGRAIRVLRERSKTTGASLAEEAGVSASWLSRIEHGEVDPTWATIGTIAGALGVPMEELTEMAERFEGGE